MNIAPLVRNARIYVRAEIIAAEARLTARLRQTGWMAVAIALVVIGLVLADIALFAALTPLLGPVGAPAVLALANFALAAMVFAAALTMRPGPELDLAEDLRRSAAAAIEDEVRSRAGGVGSRLLSAGAAQLFVPTLSTVIGALKRRKPG